MRKASLALILSLVVLSFSSCDFFSALFGLNTTTTSDTIKISGAVTLDAAALALGSFPIYVGILNYVPANTDATITWYSSVDGNPQKLVYGSQVAYSFSGVPKGKYIIGAYLDVNTNQKLDIGEPTGVYPTDSTLKDFQADASSADITISGSGGGGAPTAPVLQSPTNGATNQSVTPLLQWSASTDPNGDTVTYDVYLQSGNPNPSVKVAQDLTATSFSVTSVLPTFATCYWKVTAKDTNGGSTSSTTWSFVTGAGPMHMLQNFDFQDSGWIDAAVVYHTTGAPISDVVPGWFFSVGANAVPPNFEINMGTENTNNYVILKQTNMSADGNAISMLPVSMNYTIKPSSKLTVRFQIKDNATLNTLQYDCAPLDIRVLAGGIEYQVMIKSNMVGTGDPRPGAYVVLDQWYTASIDLNNYQTLQMHGAGGVPVGTTTVLKANDIITNLHLYVHNDHYETWVDYIDITE